MLYQNMVIAGANGWPVWFMVLLTLLLCLVNLFWKRQNRIRPIGMVLLSAAISLAGCNLFDQILSI